MTAESPAPEATHDGFDVRSAARRLVGFLVLLVVVVVALRTLPGLGEIRERFDGAAPGWIVLSAVCELASVASFPLALRGVFSRLIPWRPAVTLGLVEQGANVLVPAGGTGGLAFGAVLLQRRGVPAAFAGARTVALFLCTSFMTFFAVVVAGVAFAVGGGAGDLPGYAGLLLAAASVATIAVVVVLGRTRAPTERARHRLAELIRRGRTGLRGGGADAPELIRGGDVLVIAGSVGSLVFDIAARAAMFYALGGAAPARAGFVLAYPVGQGGALIPSPAGVGGTEAGLIGMFVLCGSPLAAATAAVLAYPGVQLSLPAVLRGAPPIELPPPTPHAPPRGGRGGPAGRGPGPRPRRGPPRGGTPGRSPPTPRAGRS